MLAALALAAACGEGGGSARAPAPSTATTRVESSAPPTLVPAAPQPVAPPAPLGTAGDPARAEADQIFATRCATCHGLDGRGTGDAAAALNPKPRDFHDPGWQAAVSDAHIEKIIQEGGGAVGKSPAMPPNPDLAGKPDVVAALRARVRGFGAR